MSDMRSLSLSSNHLFLLLIPTTLPSAFTRKIIAEKGGHGGNIAIVEGRGLRIARPSLTHEYPFSKFFRNPHDN